jgi:hypothetical protein
MPVGDEVTLSLALDTTLLRLKQAVNIRLLFGIILPRQLFL